MTEKKAGSSTPNVPDVLICRSCGAENPRKAYCCLNCFKVLRPKPKVSFFSTDIRSRLPVLAGLVVGGFLVVAAFRQFVSGVEAQVTMHLSTADASLSLTAEKRRHSHPLFGLRRQKEAPAAPAPEENAVPEDETAP